MATGTWIYEKGTVTGGGGGGGTGGGVPAPPVDIDPVADVVFRGDHLVEVDVVWYPNATATAANFLGVAVYLEDPDISSGDANPPLDVALNPDMGYPLDGNTQLSGNWAPELINESVESPAVLKLDSMKGASGHKARNIRVYLAAYGPYSHPHLVRATDTTATPTPNILIEIPVARTAGEGGQEWAFLITAPHVTVNPDYNRLVPQYTLTLTYTPPDPSIPVPPGVNRFGGCRIVFVHENDSGDPIFPGDDTGMSIPVLQADSGFKSDVYEPSPQGGKFRVYFCSEDDSQPLGSHVNSLIEGTTPWAYANVPAVGETPDVSGFTISGQETRWFADGSSVAHADFSWHLPDASNNIRYAGVFLYLVKAVVQATGAVSTVTTVPKDLSGPQSNTAINFPKDVQDVPGTPEVWTIAAISYDINGKLKYLPKDYGTTAFQAPTVTWNIGPPTPGSIGSGEEFAPLVTLGPGAAAADTQTLSSDGVNMVSFAVGPWVNPTDNKFGNAQVAMVVNHDTNRPTYYTVPANATSFQTPSIPSFGNIGSAVTVDFYLVSDDPQGNKNHVVDGKTPKIPFTYTPAAGAIIPARSGWFDDTQFSWISDPLGSGRTVMSADRITANNIYIEKVLVVGGAPNPTFQGMSNGQIAVKNSSGQLRAWMGEQQPTQGNGTQLWGGWFGQLWVGGTNPLDAPLWVDPQGIIQVGGIAARQGSQYPYLSIRDATGLEAGRIGASITAPSGSVGDNTGGSPTGALTQLTAGAWFSQLAVGGSNLSNWNVLIVPDNTKPLGSQFLMRNIYLMSIDYAAQKNFAPYNEQYKLEFGHSAWTTTAGGSWQFPGIRIYEMDTQGGSSFGAYYLNRGMVLRGTHDQGYQPLVSLVTYNGQQSGIDSPPQFWGELAMYSPTSNARTVYLASGGTVNNAPNGNPQFIMLDVSNNLLFQVNIQGDTFIKGVLQGLPGQAVTALAYNVQGRAVIDSSGHWVGQPITTSGGQTPWAQQIEGNQQNLHNAATIYANQYVMNSGAVVIDTNGAFVGVGVNVHGGGIACGAISTFGGSAPNTPNGIDTQTINCNGNINSGNVINATNGYTGGSFRGNGVNVGGAGIGCGALSTMGGSPPSTANSIDTVHLFASGNVNLNGNVLANGGYTGGSFRGNGVNVGSFGIGGGSLALTGPDGASSTCTVNGAVNCVTLKIGGTQRIDNRGVYCGSVQWPDNIFGNSFGVYGLYVGLDSDGFYDRDSNFFAIHKGIITSKTPHAMVAELHVVCDQCGSWQIQHRRKYPRPTRQVRLSDWAINEISGPKTEPGITRTVPMVAECEICHFTVEYNSMESI